MASWKNPRNCGCSIAMSDHQRVTYITYITDGYPILIMQLAYNDLTHSADSI